MKSILIFILAVIVLSIMVLIPNADAGDITLQNPIDDGYHIANNGGNISILENSTIDNGKFVICVAEGTTTIGTGFRVETGSLFYVSSGTPSEISETIDHDADGLPDWWEFNYFESITEDGAGDYDGDGYSNLFEYQEETNPNNSNSTPDSKLEFGYDELGRIMKIIRIP